jgi:hypothetical protein
MQAQNPKKDPELAENSNLQKDPEDWVTGDDPMTGAQASYLKTLTEQTGDTECFDAELTKAEASKRIDHLRTKNGSSAPRTARPRRARRTSAQS